MSVLAYFWRKVLVRLIIPVLAWLIALLESVSGEHVDTPEKTPRVASEYSQSFEDWISADPDILNELKESDRLYIMASRGSFLIGDDTINPYSQYMRDGTKEIRILLPDVHDRCKKQDWIGQRVREVKDIPGSVICKDVHLTEQIQHTVTMIKDFVLPKGYNEDRRRIEYFNALHIGKILLLDKVGYFQPYFSGVMGKDSGVYKYTATTDMYKMLLRLITSASERTVPIESDERCLCEQCE